ncbi:MAG: beta-N-acetylhexosaminidase [Deltaproteobacteria bacterium]|nr:beta-N-acetylhexosaminidase [Deltaproteobacteria bacterium]
MAQDQALAADVGQLSWIGFEGHEVDDDLAGRLARGEHGVVVVFGRNLRVVDGQVDLDQVAALTRALHAASPAEAPLWIAIDQEGGTVQRVRAPATVWPPMLRHDALGPDDEAVAHAVGLALGKELAALGFDLDFAPVLDVHTNDANPVIGARAFGRDAAAVTRRGLALARGLAEAGIVACGKHFPGHGDTTTDSHLELPRVDQPLARLEAVELAPFAAAAAAGLPMLMTAHVVFPALDPTVPATLSHAVMTGLLRERLGFRGVIVSDDLDMKAIADHVGVGEAAVAAIRAGCDALLLCRDREHQRIASAALYAAAIADPALRARIAESAGRIRALKWAHAAAGAAVPGREVIGTAAHRALASRLAGEPVA